MSDPIIWIWTPVYTYQFNWKDAANFCGCTSKIFVSHLLRSLFLVKSQSRVLLDLSVISHFVFQNQEQLLRNTSYKWTLDVIPMSWEIYTTTRRRMYSCNDTVCPLVIVKANLKTNKISRVSWEKILHLKLNFIRKFQSEKIWNLSGILFKLWKQSPGGVL